MTTLRAAMNSGYFSRLFSDGNLTKKASLNSLTATLDYGARLIVGFIVTPLLVGAFGDLLFGIWQILVRFSGYVTTAGGRPTQALKLTIANMQGSSDYEEKRRTVGSSVAVWALFLPLLLILGGSFVWFIPGWLNVPLEFTPIVRLATGVLVAKMTLLSLVRIPKSVLEGENFAYKRMGLSAAIVLIGGLLTLLALQLNAGLVGVAVAALLTTCLTGLLFLLVVRKHVPWFGYARPTAQSVRRFFHLSGWLVIWGWILKLMRASDIMLLGIFASLELVTSYSLTKYAPETLVNLVYVMIFGIMPGLGGIIGSGDHKKAIQVRNKIMILSWLISTVLGSMVLMWNDVFVRLWVGTEYFIGTLPNLLIMIMIIQFILIKNDASIIDLTLDLPRKVMMGLLSVSVSIGIAIALIKLFDLGIVGLCLGFIAGRLILSVAYPMIIGRFLGISPWFQIRSIIRPVFVTVLVFALISRPDIFLQQNTWFVVDTWMGLIFAVAATLVMISGVAFYCGLSGAQRASLVRTFQRVVA